MPEEKVIQKLKPHPFAYFFYYFGGVVIILFSLFSESWRTEISIFLTGVMVVVISEFIRRAETFYIIENGVAREFSFVSTSRTFAEYAKIQDIHVFQNIFDRIFGIGNVNINTAGSPRVEIIFRGVKDPYSIEKQIREQIIKP